MSQRIRWMLFTGCFVAGLLLTFVLGSLPTSLRPRHEIQRVISPNGQADAVAVSAQAGFFKPRAWYGVYIVPHGAPFKGVPPVLSGFDMEHVGLVWTSPRLLEIRYGRARIENFRNICRLSDKDESIEVRLVPSSAGFSYLNQTGSKPPSGEF